MGDTSLYIYLIGIIFFIILWYVTALNKNAKQFQIMYVVLFGAVLALIIYGFYSYSGQIYSDDFSNRIESKSQIITGFSLGLFFLAGFMLNRDLPRRVYLPFIYYIIIAIIFASLAIVIFNIPQAAAQTIYNINDVKVVFFIYSVSFLLSAMFFYLSSEIYFYTGSKSIFPFNYSPVTELSPIMT